MRKENLKIKISKIKRELNQKYFKGLKKSTKLREMHTLKKVQVNQIQTHLHIKMHLFIKKARKEPMRKSKYTKDYQKMYGEVLAYEPRAFHDFGANSPQITR